jgi:fructose-1,6-bisphosphatase/inositol monophosphatase family enzyme/thiamine kinase-like enzyme
MTLSDTFTKKILELTQAQGIQKIEIIQPLWNNYGTLSRVYLEQPNDHPSVIVKHIQLPKVPHHPRGFTTNHSKERKVKSYKVESAWYQDYNQPIAESTCPTPRCIGVSDDNGETFIVLEDLRHRGFTEQLYSLEWDQIKTVLRWLATFHAQFMQVEPQGLWECGTYWHLDTRPDELSNIKGSELYTFAPFIDGRLRSATFQTLVHGDAKLANFLFSKSSDQVAAVDFQYIGRGCGIQDVAYFISSCLSESESENLESEILNVYFSELRGQLFHHTVDTEVLEKEWRRLYPFAIADFHRFILGWSPGHYKNNDYTTRYTTNTVTHIVDDLTKIAVYASLQAGEYIRKHWKGTFAISSKGMGSAAADIVTEIDEQAQSIILHHLRTSIEMYDLGLLAEEGEQNDSRLHKHAFWTIDPIDGTLFFAQGLEGFAVSIGLVNRSGECILSVVYDPANDILWQTAIGQPVLRNGTAFTPTARVESDRIQLVLDIGFKTHPWFESLNTLFDIQFVGGAVMNVLHLLQHPRAFYMKPPKKRLGGCAIWDLAAVSLLCLQSGGSVQSYEGNPLPLNRSDKLYFNDIGFVFTGSDVKFDHLKDILKQLPQLEL